MSHVSLGYEALLDQDGDWAMSEGSRFLAGHGPVHETLHRISERLAELGIPYAIVGGMALFKHGVRRFTEDVDILIERSDLKKVHDGLVGLGYAPLFEGSKNLRDTQSKVKIEFLLSGGYPGDGKEKPVAFPSPAQVVISCDGIAYITLASLIELKLASGMSGADRMKDLSDVQELIKHLELPATFEDSLNEYVRPKFRELWGSTRGVAKKYMKLLKHPSLTSDIQSIEEAIATLGNTDRELIEMRDAGVRLERNPDGLAYLVTDDSELAKRFDMHDESEFFDAQ